jgi:hypothetical protein
MVLAFGSSCIFLLYHCQFYLTDQFLSHSIRGELVLADVYDKTIILQKIL